ncbi:MAG: family oxidoreductase, partial [Actinobacteria bacterium]|nr:family oxidoreductase [Actinomycetota bacterium]
WPLYVEVDEIYNLACPASPVHYQFDPVQTTKTNVHGSINMLGLAKRLKVKILQASTSEVYGDPAEHPQKESYWGNVNPIGVRSCYDEGKRCAETPRMHPNDGRVVSNFIVQALKNEPITIYGSGNQTRSFCYVDDLVTAMIAMMDQNDIVGPVNLGNPKERTIKQLALMIRKLSGSSSKIVYKLLPQDDPVRRKPDITLAKETLGWTPKVPVSEGLARTIAYFREMLHL